MKRILICIALISIQPIFSQLKLIDELPQKNGDVFFSYVIELNGNKNELFEKSRIVLADFFIDSKSSLRYENIESTTLIHNGVNRSTENLDLYFSMKIETKDNRYRISLYDLKFGYLETKSPMISIFNTRDYYKKEGVPRKSYLKRKEQLIFHIDLIKNSFIKNMTESELNDDW